MASYLTTKLDRFGLINDAPSTAERVFVEHPSTESSAEVRQVPDTDTDPDGATYFSGFRSVFELASVDVDGISQAETWMTGYTPVKAVAIMPGFVVQWDTATRLRARDTLTPEEAALVQAEYAMIRDGGDQSTHGVYLTRNALLPYDTSGAVSETIPWPVDAVTVTLSADIDSVDGSEDLTIEAQDASGTALDSSSASPGSTGRADVSLTTPDNTHFLAITVAGGTVGDPALRVDGGTTYVSK